MKGEANGGVVSAPYPSRKRPRTETTMDNGGNDDEVDLNTQRIDVTIDNSQFFQSLPVFISRLDLLIVYKSNRFRSHVVNLTNPEQLRRHIISLLEIPEQYQPSVKIEYYDTLFCCYSRLTTLEYFENNSHIRLYVKSACPGLPRFAHFTLSSNTQQHQQQQEQQQNAFIQKPATPPHTFSPPHLENTKLNPFTSKTQQQQNNQSNTKTANALENSLPKSVVPSFVNNAQPNKPESPKPTIGTNTIATNTATNSATNSEGEIKVTFAMAGEKPLVLKAKTCNAKFQNLINAYCKRKEMSAEKVKFTFDGKILDRSKSLAELDLQDGRTVDVVLQ